MCHKVGSVDQGGLQGEGGAKATAIGWRLPSVFSVAILVEEEAFQEQVKLPQAIPQEQPNGRAEQGRGRGVQSSQSESSSQHLLCSPTQKRSISESSSCRAPFSSLSTQVK